MLLKDYLRSGIKRNKKWLLVILIGFTLWGLISALLVTDYERKRDSYLNAELESFSSKVYTTLRMYETFSDYIFSGIINRDEIMDLMTRASQGDELEKNAAREQLYELLVNDYALMQQYDFRQLHFHLPNGDSFLRFHSPEKYGDNLMDIRDTIRIANQEKKYIFGFEEGRIFNGYRFVYPLMDQEEHLGSVEVSVSMGSLTTVMRGLYPEVDLTFVIDEDVVKEIVFDDKMSNYIPAEFFPGYMLDKEIFEEKGGAACSEYLSLECALIEETLKQETSKLKEKGSFSQIVDHQDERYLVTFLSIRNVSGVPVAYLIGIHEVRGVNVYDSGWLFRDLILLTLFLLLLFVSTYVYDVKQKQLDKMANTDKLTGLHNRHKFIEILEKELERHDRYDGDVSVIILDIDHFKNVNDSYGHNVGDRVLKEMAGIVLQSVRSQDLVARWGGEEFIVLLPETDLQKATVVAERVRKSVEQREFENGLAITVSLGVATVRDLEDKHLDELVNVADEKLYISKNEGRNKVTA